MDGELNLIALAYAQRLLIGSGKVSCAFGRSFARALICGSRSFSAPASFTLIPDFAQLGKSNFLKPILDGDGDAMTCKSIARTTPDSR